MNKKQKQSMFYDDEPKEFKVGFLPHKTGTWRIEIDSQIDTVSQFSSAIQALQLANEDDEVEIYLQSNGGDVDANGAFLHAIKKCRAHVHCIASGGIHSAGTHILLLMDSFELADNFNSLIHNGRSGAGGNINEYHAKSDFDKQFLYKQYWDIYEGFLSLEEFEGVMRGDNIWLDAKQWVERHNKRNEYFKAKLEQMEYELAESSKLPKPKKEKPSVTLVRTVDITPPTPIKKPRKTKTAA